MSYADKMWIYSHKPSGNFWIYPAEIKDNGEICIFRKKIAEVFSDGEDDPEALKNAKLISTAPEMHFALIGAVKVLKATEIFMSNQGLETDELNKIVRIINNLLDRVDGKVQEI